jgi:hypothetical protein
VIAFDKHEEPLRDQLVVLLEHLQQGDTLAVTLRTIHAFPVIKPCVTHGAAHHPSVSRAASPAVLGSQAAKDWGKKLKGCLIKGKLLKIH